MMIFPNLPDNARIWVYQSNRALSDVENEDIKQRIKSFVTGWVSHTQKVIADGTVLYNRFIILAADESAFNVSGCSIDGSVRFIKDLEQTFGIDLFDRLQTAYKAGDEVQVADRKTFQQLLASGKINDETLVFNNLVSTKRELESNWEVPLKDSWHKKVFAVAS